MRQQIQILAQIAASALSPAKEEKTSFRFGKQNRNHHLHSRPLQLVAQHLNARRCGRHGDGFLLEPCNDLRRNLTDALRAHKIGGQAACPIQVLPFILEIGVTRPQPLDDVLQLRTPEQNPRQ